jgi:hypothetical protein
MNFVDATTFGKITEVLGRPLALTVVTKNAERMK